MPGLREGRIGDSNECGLGHSQISALGIHSFELIHLEDFGF